ncbi:MAG: VanW family protein [Chloroflexia bacterium]|nr:VanW family protein [Chloroflexia bacterium]
MQEPKDWKFPTNSRSRHPAAENSRQRAQDERVQAEIEEWRSATRTRPAVPPRRRRRRPWLRALIVTALFFVTVVTASAALLDSVYNGRMHPAIVVGDVPVGSMTPEEATVAVDARLERFRDEPATLTLGKRTWQPSTTDLGVAVDVEGTVRRAQEAGRDRLPLIAVVNTLLGKQEPITVPYVMTIDSEPFRGYLQEIGDQVNQDPIVPRVVVEGGDVTVQGGGQGITFLPEETASRLRQSLLALSTEPVDVQVFTSAGRVDSANARSVQDQASKVVSGPVVLELEGVRREIPAQQLGEWLRSEPRTVGGRTELAVRLDRVEIETYLRELAKDIDRPGRNARLQWTEGQVQVLQQSAPGRELDRDAAVAAIQNAALSDARVIPAPVRDVAPGVVETNIQSLGIQEQVGAGESNFAGSPVERIENIRKASDAVTGFVVPAGEEFSFAGAVGDVSEEAGYRPELIGDNQRGLQGPWAGISQVSTTVFRAALGSGLATVQRVAAPVRVPYYEEGGAQPGTDAVVTLPGENLRFQNNTTAALLVQIIVGEDEMRVELYGTKPDWEVKLAEPRVENTVEPVGTEYWGDPETESGQTRLYARARAGAEIVINRQVRRPGQVPLEENYYSAYEPLPSIFVRGTR